MLLRSSPRKRGPRVKDDRLDSRFRGNERRSRARSEQGRRFRARRPDTNPRAESRSCEFSLSLFLKARAERAPCTSSRQIRAKRGGTLFLRLGGELRRIALA